MKKLFTWIMAILCVVVCAGSVMVLVANEEKNKENQDAQATAAFEDIEARLSALEQSNVSGTLDDYGNRIDALEQSDIDTVLNDYGNRIDALESATNNSERIVGIIAEGEVDPSLEGGFTFTFEQEDFEKFVGQTVKVTASVCAGISTKEGDLEYRRATCSAVGIIDDFGDGITLRLTDEELLDFGGYGGFASSLIGPFVQVQCVWMSDWYGEKLEEVVSAYATIELF